VHGFPELSGYSVGDAVPLSDGGVMVSASYRSLDESEYGPCLTRLDSEGNLLWRRPSHDSIVITHYPPQMCEVGPELFLLAAPLLTTDFFDPCLTLCNGEGTIIWQRVFRLPHWQYVRSVRSRGDGTAVVIFDTENPQTGSRVAEVIKVNAAGDSLWRHDYPFGSSNTSVSAITPTSDGGYVLLGSERGTGEHPILLFKLDSDGNVEFFRSFRFFDESEGWDIAELAGGNYLVSGTALSYQRGYLQALELLVSTVGDSLWSWVSSQVADMQAYKAWPADNGFVCLLNASVLLRFGATGELLWQRSYSLSDPYVFYGQPGSFSRDAQGRFRIVCNARHSIDAVPYLAMLMTEPDPVAAMPEHPLVLPDDLGLTVFPNPFNSVTQIEFTLPATQRVSLRLYDVLGREVAVLMNEIQTAGQHRLTFDASGLPSGVYLCRLEVGGMAQTRKMVLIK